MAAWMYTCCCKTNCNGCLHECCMGLVLGRKPERNLVFFRLKSLRPAMKGTSCARRVRSVRFGVWLVPWWCFAMLVSSCVRSCRSFWNLWLQIALSWLHRCILVAAKRIVMAAWILHGAWFAVSPFWCVIGSLKVFCNACFVVCVRVLIGSLMVYTK